MDMQALAQAWDNEPDFTDDASNDYAMRGGYMIERIARRNSTRGMLAECGHCGTILDAGTDAAHVNECEREHRPYAYGRS